MISKHHDWQRYLQPGAVILITLLLVGAAVVPTIAFAQSSSNIDASREAPTYSPIQAGIGTNVSVTAGMSDSAGELNAVEWYVDGSYVDTELISGSNATASYQSLFNTTGNHTIKAIAYADDYNRSASTQWTVNVNDTVNVWRESPTSSTITAALGNQINVTAGMSDTGEKLNAVEWYIDGSYADTVTINGANASASYQTSFNTTGNHTIKAVAYADNYNRSSPTEWTVGVSDSSNSEGDGPRARTDDPAIQPTVIEGGSLQFVTDARDEDGELQMVEYYVDGTYQDTVTIDGSHDEASWSRMFNASGDHLVEAVVYDNGSETTTISWDVQVEPDTFHAWRGAPTSSGITTEVNDTTGVIVGAHDPQGELHIVEWYVDGSYVDAAVIGSSTDKAPFFHEFNTTGEHTIKAISYTDDYNKSANEVIWNVTVEQAQATAEPSLPQSPDRLPDPNPENLSAPSSEYGRTVYSWSYASELVTEPDARQRFWTRAEEYNITGIYVSMGDLENVDNESIRQFNAAADARGIEVHALISGYGNDTIMQREARTEEVIGISANASSPAERFDGVHYDIEPKATNPSGVTEFLRTYEAFLTDSKTTFSVHNETMESLDMEVAISAAHWWADENASATEDLINARDLDLITVMAYGQNVSTADHRLNKIVTLDSSTPYELAVETDEVPFRQDHDSDISYSHYEEGRAHMQRVVQNVTADDRSSPRWRGVTLHSYSTSLSTWDSMRNVSINRTTATPGETVTVDSEVLFDNSYSESYNNGWVVAQFTHEQTNETYYVSTPFWDKTSGQLHSESLTWIVPSNATSGDYEVSTTFYDGTFDLRSIPNRHAFTLRDRTGTPPIPVDTVTAPDSLTVTTDNTNSGSTDPKDSKDDKCLSDNEEGEGDSEKGNANEDCEFVERDEESDDECENAETNGDEEEEEMEDEESEGCESVEYDDEESEENDENCEHAEMDEDDEEERN